MKAHVLGLRERKDEQWKRRKETGERTDGGGEGEGGGRVC